MTNQEPNGTYAAPTSEHIEPSPIDPLVGYLCMEFNNLEFTMNDIIQSLAQVDRISATVIWSSMMWRGRLDLISELIESRWPDPNQIFRIHWKKLVPFLREVASDRNAIIHGGRLMQVEGGIIYHFVKPNYDLDHMHMARRPDIFDPEEIRQIILDIRTSTEAVQKFQRAIHGIEPDLSSLSSSGIRRRPPRSQRRS